MIKLRSLVQSDAKFMMEYVNDEDVAKNFVFTRKPFSVEKFEEFIYSSWKNTNNLHFAIEVDGEYAGTISLKNIDNINRSAEYAVVVRKKYWGSGVAKDASKKIIDFAFYKINLNKVYLNVLDSNVRANKFYLNFGFSFEGSFKHHCFIDGKYVDLNWYSIFADEWRS